MEFTDSEIREELARLGYKDVPDDKLLEFKKDLMKLIQSERSKSNSLNSSVEERQNEEFVKSPEENILSDRQLWREKKYLEDWNYLGHDKVRPATAGPTASQRDYAARSFGLFEQPIDLGLDCPAQKYGKNNSSCGAEYCSCCCSPSEIGNRQMKRKTLRSTSAGQLCADESVSENDAAGIYELYERVRNLAMRDCECGKGKPTSSDYEPPYRISGVNKCPSFIRSGEPPHTKNLVKTLPWKRHQMYLRLWKAQPVVGEDIRKGIRSEMHAKMLQKDEIKKLPRKVFKPNKYVPPPENPRYKLRWDIRKANSQYEIPTNIHQNLNTP
ncbi:hydrolethalus syndrome protein 1 homolog [Plakobranchus ocellatus]|uniref:Hydrolethalus syndrome protein 1 homolog n=1 Tax=Plakobranchus ocellatus TaxID=259542 RepID=A0AAV4CNP9_9GAST|nr:hydrolethalus syndrome protein 1 homolog [Plakobranchus ocellatus]